MKKNTQKIAVVFNHGINDLRDINGKQDLNDRLSQYVSYMKKLGTKLSMKNCSLYYMSVNPINGGKGSTKNRKCEDVGLLTAVLPVSLEVSTTILMFTVI